jgi:hypothetical protein
LPTRYEKGTYEPLFDAITGGFLGWGKQRSISPGTGFADDSDLACDNEDLDRDGIRDVGEDVNNNSRLDPGNVATPVPDTVTTDASGFGSFDVLYAREFTWVEVALEASTTVAGSEFSSRAVFFLPGLADDFNDLLVPPPGRVSPFGIAITCACSELSDPTCPVSFPQVVITPNEATLAAGGGETAPFSVTGGTESSYLVTTTAGVLTNTITNESDDDITVNSGESFTLTTGPDEDGTTITITAADRLTAQAGTALVTQEELLPVSFTPSNAILASNGTPPVSFVVTGGTDTTYTVTIASGPTGTGLSDSDETDETTITVDSGETFTLSALPNPGPGNLTITLVAQDEDDPTLPQATAEVTQLAPSPAGPVTIIPDEVPLPAGGDIVTFNLIGGTQSSYRVTTTAGRLTNTVTTQSGRVITVNFGESFTLTTASSEDGLTITITATDNLSTEEGTATITQALPSVRFAPASRILSSRGTPPVSFTVTGGTSTTYTVTIASGPSGAGLSDADETNQPTITVAAPGETFTLSAAANPGPVDIAIILVAQDDGDPILPEATAEVTQLAPPPP